METSESVVRYQLTLDLTKKPELRARVETAIENLRTSAKKLGLDFSGSDFVRLCIEDYLSRNEVAGSDTPSVSREGSPGDAPARRSAHRQR